MQNPSFVEIQRQRRRIASFNLALFLFAGILTWRLFSLQVLNQGHYTALASQEHNRKYEVPASRGQIYLMDGEQRSPLALNQHLKLLWADPSHVQDKAGTASKLAAITGGSAADYLAKLQRPGEYVALKEKVDAGIADKIQALNIAGVGLFDQEYRVYPEGQLAAQVSGFVNSEGKGQYGIEGFLDQELAGTAGQLKAKTDTNGNPIATADNIIKQPTNGKSYVLTIDRNIQAQAEKWLTDGVKNVGATSGSLVVIDPKTGAVKAMANYPTFDPNNYSQVSDYGVFSNSVVSNMFEPGSGFKIITMSSGLDTGKVKPDTQYNDTGEVDLDGYTIKNAENHKFGTQTMTDVIQKSLNTGVIFVLRMLGGDPNNITLAGKKTLYDYITKHFGFGVPTGIEQAGEAAGKVNQPSNVSGNNVNYANMTFGQGISVTMMQMVDAAAAIANGGKFYQPYLVDTAINPDGTEHKTQPRVVSSNVISATAATQITTMMEQVVLHGSGYATKMKGYQIAGKTGTAQIPDPSGKGYLPDKNIGSFVGFAPADNPKFVMMVRVNEPKVQGFAESTAVPIFAHVAQYLLQYYAVPPSG